MNGISPFNYRKLTPEQEKRGEQIATYFSYVIVALCLTVAALWLTGAVAHLAHEALRLQ